MYVAYTRGPVSDPQTTTLLITLITIKIRLHINLGLCYSVSSG